MKNGIVIPIFGSWMKTKLDGEKERPILLLIQCVGWSSNTWTWWRIYNPRDELLVNAIGSLVSAMLDQSILTYHSKWAAKVSN